MLPTAEGVRLHASLDGIQRDIDVLENVAWGDGDHAVGFDEVVAALAALLTTEGVDKTERGAEDAGADGEAGAVGLPEVGLVAVVVLAFVSARGDFLFILEHSWFTGGGRERRLLF